MYTQSEQKQHKASIPQFAVNITCIKNIDIDPEYRRRYLYDMTPLPHPSPIASTDQQHYYTSQLATIAI
jgi:hypothetical protein